MNGWIIARGRAGEQTLGMPVAAGATSIALAGANAIFAARQRLLIGEADGTETQSLNRVTQASTTAVSFSRPVKLAKNVGAKLWRMASFLEYATESVQAETYSTQTGVATERSAGGNFYTLKIAEPQTTLTLAVSDLTAAGEQALLDWLRDEAQWGLRPFTLLDPAGAINTVRLSVEPIRRETATAGNRRVILTLVIASKGAYQ